MKEAIELWYVCGRRVQGNDVKAYLFRLVYTNSPSPVIDVHWVPYKALHHFVSTHTVLNCRMDGDRPLGVGVQLAQLPRYILVDNPTTANNIEKISGIFVQQVGGMSLQQVQQLVRPLYSDYMQKLQKKEQSKSASDDKNNAKKIEYCYKKLVLINDLINKAIQMKDITNGLAENGELYKYLKQIDIDNSGNATLSNLVKSRGVNGLAEGLYERLKTLYNRMTQYKLTTVNYKGICLGEECKKLAFRCKDIKQLHLDTQKWIERNKKLGGFVYAITYCAKEDPDKLSFNVHLITVKSTLEEAKQVSDAYIRKGIVAEGVIVSTVVYAIPKSEFNKNMPIQKLIKYKQAYVRKANTAMLKQKQKFDTGLFEDMYEDSADAEIKNQKHPTNA